MENYLVFQLNFQFEDQLGWYNQKKSILANEIHSTKHIYKIRNFKSKITLE